MRKYSNKDLSSKSSSIGVSVIHYIIAGIAIVNITMEITITKS